MGHRSGRGTAQAPFARCLVAWIVVVAAGLALAGCELDEEPAAGSGNGEILFLRIGDLAGAECNGDEPGADIDAVELLVNGTRAGYAEWARYDPPAQPLCAGNAFTAAAQALGPPDFRTESGYVSLNGGALVVQFQDSEGFPLVIEPGDEINVFEGGAAESEHVTLAVGPTQDGPWTTAVSNAAPGRNTLSFVAPAPQ